MEELIENALSSLLRYVEREKFQGYDPFDALNSPVLSQLAGSSKWLRISFIQLLRRMPLNLRPLLGIPKGYNPKGMGLFLSTYVNLYRVYNERRYLDQSSFLADWLIDNCCDRYSGYCWGYNFDWQNRDTFRPKYTPTIVTTTFIANALLDAYEILRNDEYLKIARSSCDFILNDLNRSYEGNTFCCSYSPLDKSQVYNATMLGSKLLARVYSFTNETELLDKAERTIEFAINCQNEDGSWVYGALPYQQWIDSFHTGYNLECLYDFMKFSGINIYLKHFEKGLQFYWSNFFLDDFTPKYYHNKDYPIDIHCSAQAIICFTKFGDIEFAGKIAVWTIKNMQDSSGYFYYRKNRLLKNRIPYMRWSQAWMMYALSILIGDMRDVNSGWKSGNSGLIIPTFQA